MHRMTKRYEIQWCYRKSRWYTKAETDDLGVAHQEQAKLSVGDRLVRIVDRDDGQVVGATFRLASTQ